MLNLLPPTLLQAKLKISLCTHRFRIWPWCEGHYDYWNDANSCGVHIASQRCCYVVCTPCWQPATYLRNANQEFRPWFLSNMSVKKKKPELFQELSFLYRVRSIFRWQVWQSNNRKPKLVPVQVSKLGIGRHKSLNPSLLYFCVNCVYLLGCAGKLTYDHMSKKLKSLSFYFRCLSSDGTEKIVSESDVLWKVQLCTNIFYWVVIVVRLIGRIFYCFNFRECIALEDLESECNKFGEDVTDICRKTPQTENARRLTTWIDQQLCPTSNLCQEELAINENVAFRYLMFSCFVHSHYNAHATTFERSSPTSESAALLRRKAMYMWRSIESSVRFKNVCHRLILFLSDLKSASDDDIRLFFAWLARKIKEEPLATTVRHCHSVSSFSQKDEYRSEAVMATTSVLLRCNAHIFTYYKHKSFINQDSYLTSALQMLPWFVGYYCGFDDYDITAFKSENPNTTHRISSLQHLIFEKNFRFTPVLSSPSGWESINSKAALQWDFAINSCGDLVQERWPIELMVRAAWALRVGRRFLSKELFELLQRNRTKPNINLTFYNVQQLLALSVCGLVKFTGFDGCVFQLTANKHALFSVHGYLKKPSIQELIDLKLIREINSGRFQMCVLPGFDSNHKGVKIDCS